MTYPGQEARRRVVTIFETFMRGQPGARIQTTDEIKILKDHVRRRFQNEDADLDGYIPYGDLAAALANMVPGLGRRQIERFTKGMVLGGDSGVSFHEVWAQVQRRMKFKDIVSSPRSQGGLQMETSPTFTNTANAAHQLTSTIRPIPVSTPMAAMTTRASTEEVTSSTASPSTRPTTCLGDYSGMEGVQALRDSHMDQRLVIRLRNIFSCLKDPHIDLSQSVIESLNKLEYDDAKAVLDRFEASNPDEHQNRSALMIYSIAYHNYEKRKAAVQKSNHPAVTTPVSRGNITARKRRILERRPTPGGSRFKECEAAYNLGYSDGIEETLRDIREHGSAISTELDMAVGASRAGGSTTARPVQTTQPINQPGTQAKSPESTIAANKPSHGELRNVRDVVLICGGVILILFLMMVVGLIFW